MTPEYYNDSKTYNHDELCRDNYDTIYRASCTNRAMRGIPPDGNSIGNFWIEVEKEISPEYIDGQELVEITEDQDDDWKNNLFRYIGLPLFHKPSKKTERAP